MNIKMIVTSLMLFNLMPHLHALPAQDGIGTQKLPAKMFAQFDFEGLPGASAWIEFKIGPDPRKEFPALANAHIDFDGNGIVDKDDELFALGTVYSQAMQDEDGQWVSVHGCSHLDNGTWICTNLDYQSANGRNEIIIYENGIEYRGTNIRFGQGWPSDQK